MSEPAADTRIRTACLVILTVIAIGMTLYFLRPVLVPFVLAVFFSLVLAPLLDFQAKRLRIPRPVALVITLLLGFIIVVFLSGLVATSMTRFTADAETYQAEIERLARVAADRLPLERFGINPDEDFDPFSLLPEGAVEGVLVSLTGGIAGILSQGIIVMIFVIFLLLGGSARTGPRGGVAGEIEDRVQRYLVTKVIISAGTGLVVFLILNFIGIKYALAFGAFAFLLNFIPNIGSIVATLLPLPVILLTPELSTAKMVLAFVLPGIVQFSVGNLIEPKVVGESLSLHPVAILLALIFWGMLWGIPGAFLAVPLTAVTQIVLSRVDVTAPAADLMAGRLDILTRDSVAP